MNIESEKLDIINWIISLSDETIIEKIKFLKNYEKSNDWWDEISDEVKASIDRGLEDVKAGRITVHEEVKKTYEKWL